MTPTPSFVALLAHERVAQITRKRFLGKPYVQTGEAFVQMFELYEAGAVLGTLHRDRLATFAHAFIGASGEPSAFQNYFEAVAARDRELNDDDATMVSAAMAGEAHRLSLSSPPETMLIDYGLVKLEPESAIRMLTEAANRGFILGAHDPERARARFENSNAPPDMAAWEDARAHGVDLTEEPITEDWEEAVARIDGPFREFCREYKPDAFPILYP